MRTRGRGGGQKCPFLGVRILYGRPLERRRSPPGGKSSQSRLGFTSNLHISCVGVGVALPFNISLHTYSHSKVFKSPFKMEYHAFKSFFLKSFSRIFFSSPQKSSLLKSQCGQSYGEVPLSFEVGPKYIGINL